MDTVAVTKTVECVSAVDVENSLEVSHDGELVYTSRGRWLHPLLDLEDFLAGSDLPRNKLKLRDKVIGRAAAGLVISLGLGCVHAVLLSELGADLLASHGVPYTYEELVPKIACRTEDLTREMVDPDEIRALVRALASK